MADFVLDASIATAWCFQDEASKYTEEILQAVSVGVLEAASPTLWAYEIRNSVLMGVRRKRITKEDAEEFLRSLPDLHFRLIEPASFDVVFTLADRHGLTFYDAAYLDLALRKRLPIASLDKALLRAAENSGVALFNF